MTDRVWLARVEWNGHLLLEIVGTLPIVLRALGDTLAVVEVGPGDRVNVELRPR